MPQLIPGPWFAVLFLFLIILLTIMTTKIISFKYQNEPTLQNTKKEKTQPWNWPWA